MRQLKILLVNGCGNFTGAGDIIMYMKGITNLDPTEFHFWAVSQPHGSVYEQLCKLPNTTVVPMELGGSELRSPEQLGKFKRAREVALAIVKISALVRREKIDLVYSLDRSIGTYISYAVAWLTRRPLVLSAHTTFYLENRNLRRMLLKYTRLVTVPTQYMVNAFQKYAHQVVKVPNALELENYDPGLSGEAVRRELGIPQDAPVILLAGRLSKYKGQAELIKAAPLILKEHPTTHFLLAGKEDPTDGPYIPTLTGLIKEYRLEERVHLLGHRTDLPQVIASATVVTMPSKEEPFGLVALEGMAMGKPVVASNTGGAPDFVLPNETGLLVPPYDPPALAQAILQILNNPELAQAIGHKGRQNFESYYTIPTYANRVNEVLRSVVNLNR